MHPSLLAAVQEGGAGGGGGARFSVLLIQLALFVAIFYFILIRPNRVAQKRHQEMQTALAKGDDVITDGGIVGTIIHVAENRLTIKTAENTRLVVVRSKVARKLDDEAPGEA
ncbi:MAG TPA: preprotein translocase subunit YajC [Longimicrobiales bacterium]|nr:preprotein translocase subunit YajC [Longimicrobiales bacterium]